jgi:hypothetical protein
MSLYIYICTSNRILFTVSKIMGKTHGVARFDNVDGEFVLIKCSFSVKIKMFILIIYDKFIGDVHLPVRIFCRSIYMLLTTRE